MKHLTSKLCIITFAIAVSFLSYWVYDVWPRYEIKERIVSDETSLADCHYGYVKTCFCNENLDWIEQRKKERIKTIDNMIIQIKELQEKLKN